jgi:hypothetical protein
MDTVKASIVVMSHLSDIQEANNMRLKVPQSMNATINFVKFIILKTNGNLNQEINADQMWEAFTETAIYKEATINKG